MRLTLTGYAKALYFKFIDILHFPFVKRGAHDPYHVLDEEFLLIGKTIASPSVLEIGSRNVTGITRRNLFPHCREYVGFDILPGRKQRDAVNLLTYCLAGGGNQVMQDFILLIRA